MKTYLILGLISFSALAETNMELLDRLVKDEKFGRVVDVHRTPTTKTLNAVEYVIKEFRLKPNDVLYFYVPEEYSARPVSQVGFAHRQIGMDPGFD